MAEHRLERCLAAADRVIAMQDGRVACDSTPAGFLAWAGAAAPALETPAARLFSLAGLAPPPVTVKEARAGLARGRPARRHGPSRSRTGRDGACRGGASARPALQCAASGSSSRTARSCCAASRWRSRRGSGSPSWAGTGPARARCSGSRRASPSRAAGASSRRGEVALLLQNPGDYLIHDHAVDDAGADGVLNAGLGGREEANPHDLSGGERQRLALEVVLSGPPRRRRAARRADARDGPRPPGRADRAHRRARRRRRGGDRRDPRHRVHRGLRGSGRAARPGRA